MAVPRLLVAICSISRSAENLVLTGVGKCQESCIMKCRPNDRMSAADRSQDDRDTVGDISIHGSRVQSCIRSAYTRFRGSGPAEVAGRERQFLTDSLPPVVAICP